VSFGPRLVALCALLTVQMRASRRGMRQLLGDLLDVLPPSVGCLQRRIEEAAAAVLPVYREIKTRMRQSAVVGVDETAWSLKGCGCWLWTATSPELSCYRIAPRRSGWDREPLLGRIFDGIVISDRHGAYNELDLEKRQLCWAHLSRDFCDWQERGPEAEQIGTAAEACARQLFGLLGRPPFGVDTLRE
jgi:transposase